MLSGRPAFGPVARFGTDRCRVKVAAELPSEPVLATELTAVIDDACRSACLDPDSRAEAAFLLALHANPQAARDPAAGSVNGSSAADVAERSGLRQPARVYVTACVAASTAIADAAAMISSGRAGTVVVAAGFLVDADTFGVFDAGRALARDGQVRPFSAGRQGLLLGDGAAAVVLENAAVARRRGAQVLARLAGWGRAGDAYDVCQPHPDGTGLARAITAALSRARADVTDIGYVNANGTGTAFADASEAAALHRALGGYASQVPVSSTKSVHGHALEASALVELVVTVLALRAGLLPVNAGFLAPAPECELNLVLGTAREASPRYGLSLNAAFGGASTALLVAAA
ncbi:MAG TPA: beta-ketoacyl synthase N-terminal-like domain-containing protein [Streptosporangiaceae bacterium]|nr:beta-ketoacyl synthase N-terminal-like domain-containing protein [Streptosporangiaceae bacterium]